ncbi:hypothetical protein GQ54DRAFT_297333 [Martensiomyces pterosporus]|nr:hypothetical protein GQ54DRAFT_297333 [Martensiomyces pterosporus]
MSCSVHIADNLACSAVNMVISNAQLPPAITAPRPAVAPWPQGTNRPSSGRSLRARLRKSLARAKELLMPASPPSYNRGAWGIINDVPYPPPPPYAGNNRHPPTYDEAMEIGVVASPLRIEQRMRNRCCHRPTASVTAGSDMPNSVTTSSLSLPSASPSSSEGIAAVHIPRTASAPTLTSLPDGQEEISYANTIHNESLAASRGQADGILPEIPEDGEMPPSYSDAEDAALVSHVVRQWRLGERAIEKPPIHHLGYRYPTAAAPTQSQVGSHNRSWSLF